MSAEECAKCAKLKAEMRAAELGRRPGDVIDCVVLLRRHPQHDDKAVPRSPEKDEVYW